MATVGPGPHQPTPGWLRLLAVAGPAGIAATTIGDPRLGGMLLILLELIVIPGLRRQGVPDGTYGEPAVTEADEIRCP